MFTQPVSSPRAQRNARVHAFTLLEIMIALAILGLLVGLAITNIGGIFEGSKKDVAGIFVNTTLKTPINSYKLRMGDYPGTLQDLMTAPAGKESKWTGPYIVEDTKWPPTDPWDQPYMYKAPGTHNPKTYDLYSMGPDKQDGTADDIGNWVTSSDTASDTTK